MTKAKGDSALLRWKEQTIIWSFVGMIIFTIIAVVNKFEQMIQLGVILLYFIFILLMLLPDLRKQWESGKKDPPISKNRAFWSFIVMTGIGVIIFCFICYLVIAVLSSVLGFIIGPEMAIIFILIGVSSLFFPLAILSPFYSFHVWQKALDRTSVIRPWVLATFAAIIVFVVVGVVFIGLSSDSGIQRMTAFSWGLDDPDDIVELSVVCNSMHEDYIMAGHRVDCHYSPENYSVVQGIVYYFLESGQVQINNFTDEALYPPKDLTHMRFKVLVETENHTIVTLEGGTNVNFPSRDDLEKHKQRLENFLLGLLAVAFFTIPLAIKTISDLWNKT
jgi:hypothetical protein